MIANFSMRKTVLLETLLLESHRITENADADAAPYSQHGRTSQPSRSNATCTVVCHSS